MCAEWRNELKQFRFTISSQFLLQLEEHVWYNTSYSIYIKMEKRKFNMSSKFGSRIYNKITCNKNVFFVDVGTIHSIMFVASASLPFIVLSAIFIFERNTVSSPSYNTLKYLFRYCYRNNVITIYPKLIHIRCMYSWLYKGFCTHSQNSSR